LGRKEDERIEQQCLATAVHSLTNVFVVDRLLYDRSLCPGPEVEQQWGQRESTSTLLINLQEAHFLPTQQDCIMASAGGAAGADAGTGVRAAQFSTLAPADR
jgi:hypothetical protein